MSLKNFLILQLLSRYPASLKVYKIFSGKYDTTVTNWFIGKHVERS